MEIIKYNFSYFNKWDNFIKISKNGTIFHTRKFLSYHPLTRFIDNSLIFTHKDKIYAVLPAAIENQAGFIDLNSHPGSSFGGLVINDCVGVTELNIIFNLLLRHLQNNNFLSMTMRLAPYIYSKVPTDNIDYVAMSHGFKLDKVDMCSVVCRDYINLSHMAYRNIKKAKKNNMKIIFNDTAFSMYWDMLSTHLKTRFNSHPTHSLNEIIMLKEMYPDNIILVSCYLEDKIIAGIVLFLFSDYTCDTFYISQDYNYQSYRPLALVIDSILDFARIKEYKYINFGTSTNWGIASFKEGFGAGGVLRKTYRKKL